MTCTYSIHCDNYHILIHVETTMVAVHTSVWSAQSLKQVTNQSPQASERGKVQWRIYVLVQISFICHHRITRPVLPTVQLDNIVVVEMMINAYPGSGSKLYLFLLLPKTFLLLMGHVTTIPLHLSLCLPTTIQFPSFFVTSFLTCWSYFDLVYSWSFSFQVYAQNLWNFYFSDSL